MISSLSKCLLVIFAITGVFFFVMVSQFGSGEYLGAKGYTLRNLIEFSEYLLEYSVLLGLIIFSYGPGKLPQLLRWLLIPTIVLIWTVQTLSLWFSNQPVSPLAIDNIGAAQTIVSTSSIIEAVAISLIVLLGYVLLRTVLKILSKRGFTEPAIAAAALVLACLMLIFSVSRFSIESERRSSPLHSTAVLLAYYLRGESTDLGESQFASDERLDFEQFGFRLAPDSSYPLQKSTFFETPLPFASVSGTQLPHVIVFFVEALSARKLPVYGAKFDELTPNIDRFAAKSMRVDNYFNHTQSTFRGIKGQLCSSYPVHTTKPTQWANPDFQPPSVRYKCLPHHLNDEGYKTIFLGPDEKDHMHFSHQTESVGFTHNVYREEIKRKYIEKQDFYGPFLTDVQLFQALSGVLEAHSSEQPLFIAGYFKDSHVGQDSKPDGIKYGDGSDRILNTLHTFDKFFGEFLKAFEQSARSDNTIIVLTSDHAHWPERPYINMAGKDFNQTPVDEIALLVHSPSHELPPVFDANIATSLSFAPTLAHLLDLRPATNYFLGQSLFAADRPAQAVAWFNNAIFSINEDGKVKRMSVLNDLPEDVSAAWSAISLTHRLELSDTIQPLSKSGNH
ncbi:MAG: LTA synthase family protein [Pseudomonadales bacterium]